VYDLPLDIGYLTIRHTMQHSELLEDTSRFCHR
jgi:hypothetical protein